MAREMPGCDHGVWLTGRVCVPQLAENLGFAIALRAVRAEVEGGG